MYDSREKAALDLQSVLIDAREEGHEEGREEGFEQGLEIGEIKLIRTLQEILGEPMSAESDLANQGLEQLQAIAAELRERVLGRS
jgi:flagellar biosynthesis/type III secretory pathway protein FliH